MHPMVKNHPRLKQLYDLDQQITKQLLGMGKNERKKLEKLREQVRAEIRSTDIWEPIRAEIRKRKEAATPTEDVV